MKTMTTWSTETISKIASTDDLHIYPFRADGKTYGTPTWIWSVVVDGRLFVRAYNGINGRWYNSALAQKPDASTPLARHLMWHLNLQIPPSQLISMQPTKRNTQAAPTFHPWFLRAPKPQLLKSHHVRNLRESLI
ncbi:hypothetical protein KaCgl_17110 [Corynebacterium glutamicum]|nr:uncharacterized protein conserved in bacteria [Corynebacterium glutamicum]BCB33737.1 hypothetical protein KaCgl_17110 [Corynebacterium glutamicum]